LRTIHLCLFVGYTAEVVDAVVAVAGAADVVVGGGVAVAVAAAGVEVTNACEKWKKSNHVVAAWTNELDRVVVVVAEVVGYDDDDDQVEQLLLTKR